MKRNVCKDWAMKKPVCCGLRPAIGQAAEVAFAARICSRFWLPISFHNLHVAQGPVPLGKDN